MCVPARSWLAVLLTTVIDAILRACAARINRLGLPTLFRL